MDDKNYSLEPAVLHCANCGSEIDSLYKVLKTVCGDSEESFCSRRCEAARATRLEKIERLKACSWSYPKRLWHAFSSLFSLTDYARLFALLLVISLLLPIAVAIPAGYIPIGSLFTFSWAPLLPFFCILLLFERYMRCKECRKLGLAVPEDYETNGYCTFHDWLLFHKDIEWRLHLQNKKHPRMATLPPESVTSLAILVIA